MPPKPSAFVDAGHPERGAYGIGIGALRIALLRAGVGMAVLASGGASRKELELVIRTAMKAWPAAAEDSADICPTPRSLSPHFKIA